MAAQGWAELVAWMQERSAAGKLDVEAVWEQFRALAATSEQPGLPALTERFHAAPAKDRLALAGTIAGMLGPVEWPAAWRGPRERLVKAIDELVRAISSYVAVSPDPSARIMSRPAGLRLNVASKLLLTPCRRDQLTYVTALCDEGIAQLRDAAAMHSDVQRRVAVAFGAYAEAARGLNDACGVVLFRDLDWRVEGVPT